MLDVGRASTASRVCIGVAAAAVICLLLMAVVKFLGWNGERQQPVLTFIYNSTLFVWLMWAFRKQPIKGMAGYLLFFYGLAGVLAFSAVGMAAVGPRVADTFGTEIELVIDQCQPRGSRYFCSGNTTENPPRMGGGIHNIFYKHGDIVRGTYYSGIFGGFAEGGHAAPRPAIGSSLATAVALLAGILLIVRALVKALRTPSGSLVWEPKDSVFVDPRLDVVFRWGGLVGALVAIVVSVYLFMVQLSVVNEETASVLTLSAGDWMTVASVAIGFAAWGFRKSETPLGKKIIALSSKVTLVGLLCIGAIFAVLESASLSRRFIVTAPQTIWDSIDYIGRLQRGFTVPMLLAAAALLLAAHLMTLQFWEARKAPRHQSEASSVFRPDIQKLIDFLALHSSGYGRARLDKQFPDSEPILAQLHSIGLVVQVRKRPRLTPQGKRFATINTTGT